jgi:Zn-dependent protease
MSRGKERIVGLSGAFQQVAFFVFDLSLQQLLIRGGACLIIFAIHGFALAGLARAFGDHGPQFDGRLTLNPFGHLDIVGAAMLIVAQLGWIQLMAIDPATMRLGRVGCVICLVGSLAATLAGTYAILALRIPVLMFMPTAAVPTVVAILNDSVETGVWFVAFNLLPIPPLTGANFVVAAYPGAAKLLVNVRLYAGLAVAALILLGIAGPVVRPLHDALVFILPPP